MCKDLTEYHAVSVYRCPCDELTVRHARLDRSSGRLTFELMALPEPTWDLPWVWPEALIVAASELLQRELEDRQALD